MTLKLEVGKKYRNRRGEVVEITKIDYRGRFTGSSGIMYREYREDGSIGFISCDADLIEEVIEPVEPQRKPHKHAELIKAWADGAEIQARLAEGYGTGGWYDTDIPTWGLDKEYRIKPEPKPDVVLYFHVACSGAQLDGSTRNIVCVSGANRNLKVTFDGETGEIKDAEVIK